MKTNLKYLLVFAIIAILFSVQTSNSQVLWQTMKAGNWNTSNLWQKSTDGGGTWVYAGTAYPNAVNDCIEFIGHAVVMNVSATVTECWIASTGSLTINSGCTLTMTSGSSGNQLKTEGVCTNNGTITLNTGIWTYIYNTFTNGGTLNNYSSGFSVTTDYSTLYGAFTTSSGKTFSNSGTVTIASGCSFTNSGTYNNYISTTAGTLTISGGGTFTNNGTLANKFSSTNCTINVSGTFANSVDFTTYNGTINVNNGGTYKHMFTTTPGTIPTCTWNTGSTCEIAGYTCSAQLTTGLSQSFHHFKWNCTSCTCDMTFDLPATLTVNGDLTLASTGTYYSTGLPNRLNLGWSRSSTINVGGNMYVTGGYWYGNLGGYYTAFNVTGNFSQSGGYFVNATSNVSGNSITVNGNFALSGTSKIDLNKSSSSYTVNLTVKGDFSLAANDTITSSYGSLIKFNKTGTQTYTNGGTFSGVIDYSVESGSILNFASASTTLVNTNASSDFSVQSGGGMRILHANGLSSTGCVQVGGTSTYSTTAYYEYYTTGTQVTGTSLPTTVRKFTKSGSGTTTLSNSSLTISDSAKWTAGTLSIASKTLTMNGVCTNTAGTLSCDASTILSIGGTGTCTLPTISGGSSSLTINRSGTTISLGGALTIVNLVLQAGTLDLGSNTLNLNGDITNSGGALTIQSTSSMSFGGSGSKLTMPSGVTAITNLTINRANGVDLNSDLTVSGTLTLTAGAFSIGAHTLTLNGAITTTSGTITGGSTSNISIGGTTSTTLPSVSGGINNFTLSRTNGLTFGGSQTINGTTTLTTGALTLGAGNTLTLNGAFSYTSGSITGSQTSNLIINNYASAVTLTPYLTLCNLTINRASGVTLSGWIAVYGTLTLTSGSLNLSSYSLQLYSDLAITSGTLNATSSSTITVQGTTTPAVLNLPSNITALSGLYINRTNGVNLNSNLTLSGTLTLASGNLILGSNTLTLNSSISRTSGYIYGGTTSDVVFGGTTATTLYVTNGLRNLTLNRSGGITLGSSLDLSGTLTMTAGTLTLGANNLSLSATSTISGTITSANMIVMNSTGVLRKYFTGTGTFVYPVGTTTYYSPATLTFTSGTFGTGAYLDLNVAAVKHTNNTSSTNYLKRYWAFTNNNITGFTYNISMQYISPTDVNGTESQIYTGKWDGSSWMFVGSANTVSHTLEGTGLSSFSTFTGGEQSVMPVKLSSFSSSVKDGEVKLLWLTDTELNNMGFEIERKNIEGKNEWLKLGFVIGKGTANTPSNYTFEDKKLSVGKYQYRLKQIDYNSNFEYHNLNGEVSVGIPSKFDLSQNYPNPFNPTTKIDFQLPVDSKVSLIIYDITGREVNVIMNNEFKKADYYTVLFSGSNMSSGTYFYRIVADKYVMTKKMMLVK